MKKQKENESVAYTVSFKKKMLYLLIMFIAIFFIAEAVSCVIYYHRNRQSSLAVISLFKIVKQNIERVNKTDEKLSQEIRLHPGITPKNAESIITETQNALKFEYTPWLMYKSTDVKGKYVNVSNFVRKSIPDSNIRSKDQALRVFFFGGSTVFGVSVTDNETIPSYFVEILKKKGIQKKIKVYNYGVPTYFSYQEFMLFFHLIQSNQTPDIAIFFDGLNDFLSINAARFRKPMLDHYYQTIFNGPEFINHPLQLEYSFDYSLHQPSSDSLFSFSQQLKYQYLLTQQQIKKIAVSYNIKTYFFLQPVPYYLYTNRKEDPVCDQTDRPQFSLIYPEMEKIADTSKKFCFLGNLLYDEKGLPFADELHYSPLFNRKIAEAIFSYILPEIKN